MGATGDEGRHAKPEGTKAEGHAEETAAEEQIKYPGGQSDGTSGTGGEEEQIKYPG
jgi:hypothetical protein